jgi:hypothetical protein
MIPEPLTRIGHALFGFLCALAAQVNATLSIIGFILFLVYELDEEWRLGDEAYEEIAEFLYGYAAALTLLVVMRAWGVM